MATDETTHVENEDQVNASSASNDEHMIPKSRLDEVLKANKDLQVKLEQVEKERQEQLEAQLKEQGRYKELAEQRAKELAELKPKAETVDTYEATLISVFNTQLAEIPENMRGLIPDIGAGKQGGSAPETLELTPEELETAKQFGMSPEEYAKYK